MITFFFCINRIYSQHIEGYRFYSTLFKKDNLSKLDQHRKWKMSLFKINCKIITSTRLNVYYRKTTYLYSGINN